MPVPILLSIVSPCFNEEENVDELYRRIIAAISKLDNYQFEFIFIDNASTDDSLEILRDRYPFVELVENKRLRA